MEPSTLERKVEKLSLASQPPVQTPSFVSPGTRDFVACNHLRSYKYYSSSIFSPDGFLGYPCASYDEFQEEEVGHTRGAGRMCLWYWWWWVCPCGLEQNRGATLQLIRRGPGNAEPHRSFLSGVGWAGGEHSRPELGWAFPTYPTVHSGKFPMATWMPG